MIHHYTAIKIRAQGTGNLKLKFQSLSEVYEQDLVPLSLEASTNRQATRLSNFNQERATLKIETTEINEYFEIKKIIIFFKPVATDYPG
jgi:hypothetical protein